ncbi:hypothetical protein AB0H00_17320 [Nocardia sp. NPDC023852]|uniref:hypothetical protein n=1 Tax=Nocardia sp. NPDC023852 TaxID=3154697 RepID=UPI0033F4DE55
MHRPRSCRGGRRDSAESSRNAGTNSASPQLQIGDLGGPSAPTIRKIEDGDATISTHTLNKLDVPLRWLPGSAARTYAGGAPAADDPSAAARGAGESVVTGPDSIRFEIADLTGLLAAAGRLTDAVEHGRTTDPQVVAAITQLDRGDRTVRALRDREDSDIIGAPRDNDQGRERLS